MGVLQSDGYEVMPRMRVRILWSSGIGPWAHARRKFIDAQGGNPENHAGSAEADRGLYRLKRTWDEADLAAERDRDERARPRSGLGEACYTCLRSARR